MIRDKQRIMQNIFIVILLLVFLAVAAVFGVYIWTEMGDVAISTHGWIALVAGTVLSLVIGCGLMALAFFSARHGHDEANYNQVDVADSPSDQAPSNNRT